MVSQRYRAQDSLGNKINRLDSARAKGAKSPGPITTDSVTTDAIAPGSVTSEALAPDAVDSAALGPGAVGTENLGIINEINSDSDLDIKAPGLVRINGVSFGGIVELGGGVNLDTLTDSGLYHQRSSAEAGSGSNYPVALAGVLEVTSDGAGYIYHAYQTYGPSNRVFIRGQYSSAWSAWKELSAVGHTHSAAEVVGGTLANALLPTRLQTLPTDISGLDLNNITETGWSRGSSVTNAPSANWYYYETIAHASSWIYQRAIGFGPVTSHVRTSFQRWKSNNVWQAWEPILTDDAEIDARVSAHAGVPFAVAAGKTNLTSATAFTTITFPASRFTTAPIIQTTVATASLQAIVLRGTYGNTSFQARLYTTGGIGTTGFIEWTAIQMTSGAAAG